MARVVQLTDAFTDLTNPLLRSDPILTDGSLLLVDPVHHANPWPAGVPANAALLPNLAQLEARTVLGDQAAEVRPAWRVGGTWVDGTTGKFERTPMGGLHGIVSKNLTAGTKGQRLQLPTSLINYLVANQAHSYFISFWSRITRTSGESNPSITPWMVGFAQADNSLTSHYMWRFSPTLYRPSVTLGARSPGTIDATGNAIRNMGVAGSTGSITAGDGSAASWGLAGLTLDAPVVSLTGQPSFVLYRSYIEDLTVSGRTYLTVDAIDQQLYTKHLLTAGGRYYADTIPTDPSAIP